MYRRVEAEGLKEVCFMKMIFAIVRKEDEGFVIERLNKEKISVTKLSSTGGFLRKEMCIRDSYLSEYIGI